MEEIVVGGCRVLVGDCREVLVGLGGGSVGCVVTSPPYYGLRDYGVGGQIGLEAGVDDYVGALVGVFREVRRVLRDDGTVWLNLGDSYANDGKWGGSSGGKHAKGLHGRTGVGRGKKATGLKPKDLIGIPWRVAFALQEDGWWLRQDIIWSKPNPMPESVRDRCTKSHEYVFLLSKGPRYYFDGGAIREAATGIAPGNTKPTQGGRAAAEGSGHHRTADNLHRIGAVEWRNRRSVWSVPVHPFDGAHFATFPPDLVAPCIKAGCPVGGTVLDPFGGAGTTGLVAERLGRRSVLVEINPEYARMAAERIRGDAPLFA